MHVRLARRGLENPVKICYHKRQKEAVKMGTIIKRGMVRDVALLLAGAASGPTVL